MEWLVGNLEYYQKNQKSLLNGLYKMKLSNGMPFQLNDFDQSEFWTGSVQPAGPALLDEAD